MIMVKRSSSTVPEEGSVESRPAKFVRTDEDMVRIRDLEAQVKDLEDFVVLEGVSKGEYIASGIPWI
jgi:hypothetical protein